MKVLLPHPSQLSFHQGLPQLVRTPTPQSQSGSGRPSGIDGGGGAGRPSSAASCGSLAGDCGGLPCTATVLLTGAGGAADSAGTPWGPAGRTSSSMLLADGGGPSLPGSPAPPGPGAPGSVEGKAEGSDLLPAGSRVGRLMLRLGMMQTSGASGAGPSTAPAPAAPPPPPPLLPGVGLKNKAPHWNDGLRCWCLNFRGRVRLASVKNFQVCGPGLVRFCSALFCAGWVLFGFVLRWMFLCWVFCSVTWDNWGCTRRWG